LVADQHTIVLAHLANERDRDVWVERFHRANKSRTVEDPGRTTTKPEHQN
jgi:hypothetical protein